MVIKPVDPLSLYGSYSVSYLPASGDQFGALTSVTSALQPEKFTNKEIGSKWDITPLLTLHARRSSSWIARTPESGIRRHRHRGRGRSFARDRASRLGLAGYVTDKWQISAGYANLNARFVTDTSNAGRHGGRARRRPRAVRADAHLFALEPL